MQKEKNSKHRPQNHIFKCEKCEKYFFHKVHLSLHERGHLNQLFNGVDNNNAKSPRTQKNSTSSTEKQGTNSAEKKGNESLNRAKQKNEPIDPRAKKLTRYVNKSKIDSNLSPSNRTNLSSSLSYENFEADLKYNLKNKSELNKSPKKTIIMKTEAIAQESNEKFFLCNICGLTFNQIGSFKEHENKHKYMNKKKPISGEIKSVTQIKQNAYNKTKPRRKLGKLLRDKNLKNFKQKLKKKFSSKKNAHKINLMKKQLDHKKNQSESNEEVGGVDSSNNLNSKIKHSCRQCEKTFFHLQHLRLHEKNHMNMNLKIIEDDKKKDLKQSASLNRCEFNSLKADDNNKLYECTKCDKSFFHLNHLRIHERIHKAPDIVHSQKEAIHFNIIEEESSPNQLSLSISISPSGNIESTEDVADETRSESIEEISETEKYLEKSYQCKKCNKTFFHELHLKMHQRSHTKIQSHKILKPHKCTQCVASFLELTNLEKHVLQMHEKKSYVFSESLVNRFKQLYKCDECEKEFKAKSHLASHKRAHFKDSSKEFNDIENGNESLNNIYIVEEIYGNYDFKNDQTVLYSDVYTENQPMRSVMNIPCNIALDENNSSYEKTIVNEFLYKCKFCDLLLENEQVVKDHISVEHEKSYLNSFENADVPVKIENHLITNSNSSESYIQKLDFNEHNYHLIQISDLYFENNYNNNIESMLPQIISSDKMIPNASNSIEIKNFSDLIKIDQKKS